MIRIHSGRPVLWGHGLQVHDLTQEVGKPQDPLEWVMEFPLQPLSRISMREGEVEEHFDLSPLEEYDPHTYYRYKPNLDQRREFWEHPLGGWTLRTNGIGLRMDREVDSDVGVEDLTAIPRLAAAYLDNLRRRRIEVFDLGDRSIGAFEPLHYWKENHGLNVKAQRRIALHLWRAIGQ